MGYSHSGSFANNSIYTLENYWLRLVLGQEGAGKHGPGRLLRGLLRPSTLERVSTVGKVHAHTFTQKDGRTRDDRLSCCEIVAAASALRARTRADRTIGGDHSAHSGRVALPCVEFLSGQGAPPRSGARAAAELLLRWLWPRCRVLPASGGPAVEASRRVIYRRAKFILSFPSRYYPYFSLTV